MVEFWALITALNIIFMLWRHLYASRILCFFAPFSCLCKYMSSLQRHKVCINDAEGTAFYMYSKEN